MSKELIVAKDVAYAAKVGGGTIAGIGEINLLQVGALAVFSVEDNTLITTSIGLGALQLHKQFRIAVGEAVNDGSRRPRWSQPFDLTRRNPLPITLAYEAPVKQKWFIGNNGSAGSLNFPTLAAGMIAKIRFYDTSDGVPFQNEWFGIEYVVKAGDTNATVLAAIISKVNNHQNSFITAAVVPTNVGLSFEHKVAGKTFDFAPSELFAPSTITKGASPAVQAKVGNGTYLQLKEYERILSPKRGNTNQMYMPQNFYDVVSNLDTAETYDILNIVSDIANYKTQLPTMTQTKYITVALPTDGAGNDAFTEILTNIFNPNDVLESAITVLEEA